MGFHSSELLPLLAQLSYVIPFALLPGLLYYVLDTQGWRSLHRHVSQLTFLHAFAIHVSSEAIVKSIPLGVPLSDSIRSLLLKRECNVPMTDGFSGAVSRRMYLGLSQGVYFIVGGVLGFSILRSSLENGIAGIGVEWVPVFSGTLLVVGLILALILLSSARAKGVFQRVCLYIPWSIIRMRIEALLQKLGTDHQSPCQWPTVVSLFWFFAYWCVEAAETYVFVRLLGIPASLLQVIAVEMVVSTLRLAAFFLPSGIGVQDVGYASMMASLGCVATPGDAAGLVLLKRAKDIFWIAIGYFALLAKGIKPFQKISPVRVSKENQL